MDAVASGASRGKRASKKIKLDDSSNMEASTSQVQVKKRPTGKQRNLGKLAHLINCPMDVLFEIFGHLFPLDILHLARTTKEFRRVLMHRSSISVWRSARQNVPHNFPDCPEYMSEPQYTNLAFDTHCNACLANNIRTVYWEFRVRLCKNCAKEKIVDSWHLTGEVSTLPSSWRTMVSRRIDKNHVYVYASEVDSVIHEYNSLDRPDAQETYMSERRALVTQYNRHAGLCENWAHEKAQDRSQELEEARQNRKRAIIERLAKLGYGEEIDKLPFYHCLDHHKLVKEPKYLTDRIWKRIEAPLVKYMEEMKASRLAREHKKLVISRKPVAIAILRAFKAAHLPQTEVMPEPVDFCDFPEIKTILNSPREVAVDEDSFSEVIPLLPDLISRWRTSVLHKLIQHVDVFPGDSTKTDQERIDKMKLATTVFNCSCCDQKRSRIIHTAFLGLWFGDSLDSDSDSDDYCFEDDDYFPTMSCFPRDSSHPLFYPRVLGHYCLTRDTSLLCSFESQDDASIYTESLAYGRIAWTHRTLKLNENAGSVVKEMVKACGLDPAVTTADDMDKEDPRLGCLNCIKKVDNGETEIQVFGWRRAIRHHGKRHTKKAAWKRIVGSDLQKALEAEDQERQDLSSGTGLFEARVRSNPHMLVWACVHCRDLPEERELMGLDEMKVHQGKSHDISEPELNRDYYEDYEGLQSYRSGIQSQASTIRIEM